MGIATSRMDFLRYFHFCTFAYRDSLADAVLFAHVQKPRFQGKPEKRPRSVPLSYFTNVGHFSAVVTR